MKKQFFVVLLLSLTCVLAAPANPGDVDGNGVVDVSDLILILSDKAGAYNSRSDSNNDGVVDLFDLVLAAKHYGTSYGLAAPQLTATQTPSQARVEITATCPQGSWCQIRRVDPDPDVMIQDGATSGQTYYDATVSFGSTYTYNARYWLNSVLSNDRNQTVSVQAVPSAGLLFEDTFETGDFKSPTGGFSWSSRPPSGGHDVFVANQQASAGSYSARFRFPASAGGVDSWAEQRFSFPQTNREAWVEYYLYIPANYKHRSQTGFPDPTSHHKFYALWGVDYIGSGRPKTVLELWRVDDDTSQFRFVQNLAGQPGSFQYGTLVPGISASGPLRKGQWHRIRIHQDTGTLGGNNAKFLLLIDNTVVFNFTGINNNGNNNFYWDGGYLMGYTNGGYDQQTDFFIDDFKLYNQDPGWSVAPFVCTSGQTRQCGATDVGSCSYGTETCASNAWGACIGAVGPATEVCDGQDNNCDGSVDEGCSTGTPTYPNQPSGMAQITRWDGTSTALPAGWNGGGSLWTSRASVVNDATNPAGTGKSLQVTFPAGPNTGTPGPINVMDTFPGGPYDEMYIMYRIYYDPIWEDIGHKHFYWGAPRSTRVVSYGLSSPTQYFTTREASGGTYLAQQYVPPSTNLLNLNGLWGGANGGWTNIEIHAIAESAPGVADGKVYYYHNGVLIGSKTNVQWVRSNDTEVGFDGLEWYHQRNADHNQVEYYRIGELYVSGKNRMQAPTDPQPSGSIRFDTRAGGSQSIQAAGVTTLAQAQSATGFTAQSDQSSPYVADFVTDADGLGSHAFRFNWRRGADIADNEHDMMIWRGMSGLGLNNANELYIQWKIWQGRTASGGGVGTNGMWDAYSTGPGSGKRIVWFRGSGSTGNYRFTFAPGNDPDYLGGFFFSTADNPDYATTPINWDNYSGQWITLTFRLKPESSVGAGDGLWEAWFNGIKFHSKVNAASGTADFQGELQIGGPTWIGAAQDQTMYIKDIVVWQP